MRKYLLILVIGFSQIANSQNIEGLSVQLEGTDLVISFNLKPVKSINELYDISILSSMDSYSNPITLKSGNTTEVPPGNNLTYVIDGESEFKGFKGDLDFRVTADLSFAPIRLLRDNIAAKRGRIVNLSWEGGYRNESYAVELFKNETRIASIAAGITTTSTLWAVTNDSPVGSGFTVKVSSETDPGKSTLSTPFAIRRKVAVGVKLLPFIAAGGAVGALTILGGGGGEPGPGGGGGTTESDLPDPPDLPVR